MSNKPINKAQLGVEFVSVVFAVLLALLLNNCREGYKISKTVDRVKTTIRAEILQNDLVLTESLAYRKSLISNLRNNTHQVVQMPINDIPVDVNRDSELELYLSEELFKSRPYVAERVSIVRLGGERYLILDDYRLLIRVEDEDLKLFGHGNIQLRTAGISDRSWEIAQATGVLVEFDFELVDALSNVHSLNKGYFKTSDKAIEMIYKAERGTLSVLEDMAFYEEQILKADSILLTLLD